MYENITHYFNEYSKENNLNIKLESSIFSDKIITQEKVSYDNALEYLLYRKSQKYDIYAFDPVYMKQYSKHLEDLKYYIPQEHLDMYSEPTMKEISVFQDKWLGLPFFIKYMVLYANNIFLNKYNKPIPKTWDELHETAKYILEQERLLNNTELIGYNGFFSSTIDTVCGVTDLIYSFRDSKNSPFPGFNSENAINSLNKIMELKNDISPDGMFTTYEDYSYDMLFESKLLFSKMWDCGQNDDYTMTLMPGNNEGVSGSCIEAFSLGINKYISEEHKKAAAEVIKYFTSMEAQKKLIIKDYKLFTPLMSLYDDEESCTFINCELGKQLQGINRDNSLADDYDNYATKIEKLIYQFLSNEKTAQEVLIEIENITKIHFISIKSMKEALIIFILLLITLLVVLLSIILIFIPKLKPYFNFLSNTMWLIYIIGNSLIIFSEIFYYGILSVFKCHMINSLRTVGYIGNFTPILCQLLIKFPIINKYSKWIEKHKLLFNLFVISIEILFNILSIISPYKLEDIYVEDGQNYNKCHINNFIGNLFYRIQNIYILIIYIGIIFLIFLEWNIQETFYYIRIFFVVMIMDGLSLILIEIIKTLNFNFKILYTIRSVIIILFLLTNQIYLFGIQIIFNIINEKKEEDLLFIKVPLSTINQCATSTTNESSISHQSNISSDKNDKSKTSQTTNKRTSIVLSLHNSVNIETYDKIINNNSNNNSINNNFYYII
ncbi:periplasmic binding protein-like II [Neocallimastix lanati (nom. inval.)]|nr:periplasmic binding protein-like II [Neocallimastix sp. JGI-2020a]